jgi:hypothetical protein
VERLPGGLLAGDIVQQVAQGKAVFVAVVAPGRAGIGSSQTAEMVVVQDRPGVADPSEAGDLEPGGPGRLVRSVQRVEQRGRVGAVKVDRVGAGDAAGEVDDVGDVVTAGEGQEGIAAQLDLLTSGAASRAVLAAMRQARARAAIHTGLSWVIPRGMTPRCHPSGVAELADAVRHGPAEGRRVRRPHVGGA